MKKLLLIYVLFFSNILYAYKSFPSKPITIIVYTKPGGAIDIFTRKFKVIAKKYTDAQFIIINKPGAGGLIALNNLIRKRSDGYTIAAVTKSNVAKIVTTNTNINEDFFNFIGLLTSDPEALIVKKGTGLDTLSDLVKNAKINNGQQIWVGPATGGNDHIMAIKSWNKLGIKGKWIPYSGGGKAMIALLGKHGNVYVGNPGDIIGKPSLKIIAISSTRRLGSPFEKVQTFEELGIKDFSNEIMWRGFISKRNTPIFAKQYYKKLFNQISSDPEWIKYILSKGATPVNIQGAAFKKIFKKDYNDFTNFNKNKQKTYLNKKNIIYNNINNIFFITILLSLISIFFVIFKNKKKLNLLTFILLITLATLTITETFHFPSDKTGVRWFPFGTALLLLTLCFFEIFKTITNTFKINFELNFTRLFLVIFCSFSYLFFMSYLGYYCSSFIFALIVFYCLGLRKHKKIFIITLVWVTSTYLLFFKLLMVPLPVGFLFDNL